MDDASPLFGLILFVIFLIINAIMFCFREGLRQLNSAEVEKRAQEGSKRAGKILKLIERPKKLDNAIYTAFIMMAMVVGNFQLRFYIVKLKDYLIEKAANYLHNDLLNIIAFVGVLIYLTFIMLAIGVLFPQRIGSKYPKKSSFILIGFVYFIMFLLRPVTLIITFLTDLILRIFGMNSSQEVDNVTEEEIMSMVNEGHEQGVLLESEAEMINNIFELNDKAAEDIMTHRKSIIAVDGQWTLLETAEFLLKENKSRFPVYIENIDNIIGVLHIRDVLSHYYMDERKETLLKDIDGIIRNTYFIPETRSINILFKEMQTTKMHMAVVVDEYGQTAGIITMEDILEEIVGNILDEYDIEEDNITSLDENNYIVKGMTTLEELEEVLEMEFDTQEYDTLNGYLISKLDRIPSENEKPEVIVKGNIFQVLEIANKTISLVKITINEDKEEIEEETLNN